MANEEDKWTDMESDVSDNVEVNVQTKNMFDVGVSGWSDVSDNDTAWKAETVLRKRKKRSSTGTNGDSDVDQFTRLSTDDKLVMLFETITRLEKKQSDHFGVYNDITHDLRRAHQKLTHNDNAIAILTKKSKMLSYRSLDLEARSRRNNLIFWGLTERMRYSDRDLINRFLASELGLHLTNNYNPIQRAHRLGPDKKVNYDQKRPIIVNFMHYEDTETILRSAYKLRGTNFMIDRDYPKEIVEARKKMYDSQAAREGREAGKRVEIKYPARLYINNVFEDDALPDWFGLMRESRTHGFESNPINDNSGTSQPEIPPRSRYPNDRGHEKPKNQDTADMRRDDFTKQQSNDVNYGQTTRTDQEDPRGHDNSKQTSRDNTQNTQVGQNDVLGFQGNHTTCQSNNSTSLPVNPGIHNSPETIVKQLFKTPAPRGRSQSQSKNVKSSAKKSTKSSNNNVTSNTCTGTTNTKGSQMKPTVRGRSRSVSSVAKNRQRVNQSDNLVNGNANTCNIPTGQDNPQ
jgi:hypothetical protein